MSDERLAFVEMKGAPDEGYVVHHLGVPWAYLLESNGQW